MSFELLKEGALIMLIGMGVVYLFITVMICFMQLSSKIMVFTQYRDTLEMIHQKLEKEGIRTWFLGKEGHALLKRKGYDEASLPMLSEEQVNKEIVLEAVKNW